MATATMHDPILQVFYLEPRGEVAQYAVASLSLIDSDLLKVTSDVVPKSAFEHDQTNYIQEADGNFVVGVIRATEAATLHQAARSAKCKMVDATRVPEDLDVTVVTTVTCGDVDKQSLTKAFQLVRDKSQTRCELEGRGLCCKPDAVVGNIGPLFFCSGTITLAETCWEVTSQSRVANHFQLVFGIIANFSQRWPW